MASAPPPTSVNPALPMSCLRSSIRGNDRSSVTPCKSVILCMYVGGLYCISVFLSVYQLVTCIPTRRLPRSMTLGSASHKEIEEIERAAEEEDDAAAAAAQRGQILWVRGLSRLQHQVMMMSDGDTFSSLINLFIRFHTTSYSFIYSYCLFAIVSGQSRCRMHLG